MTSALYMPDVSFPLEPDQEALVLAAADAVIDDVMRAHHAFVVIERQVKQNSVAPHTPYVWARFFPVEGDPRRLAGWFASAGGRLTMVGCDGSDMVCHFEVT